VAITTIRSVFDDGVVTCWLYLVVCKPPQYPLQRPAVFLRDYSAVVIIGITATVLHCWKDISLLLLALLTRIHALLFGLLIWHWNAKVLLTVILLTTAFAVHYMNSFRVYLDADMLHNVLVTDVREARELPTPAVFWPLFVYVALPCVLLWQMRFRAYHPGRALLRRGVFLIGAVVMIGSFQEISALLRNHRKIRHLATSVNYLVAFKQNLTFPNPIRQLLKWPWESMPKLHCAI